MDWRILSTDTVLAAARAWIKRRTDDPQTVGVGINKSGAAVMRSMADEITRLRARVEELEGGLEEIKKLGWETVKEQHAHVVARRLLRGETDGS